MKMSKMRAKRFQYGMSAIIAAKEIGISKSYFYQIENCSKLPSVKVMKKICKVLDADPKELFFSDEKER